ncbi:MAG: universal stress protein [Chloroflexi bacterium]|nr:universal stress protein [Chloroflexota bacterium]
MHLLLCTDGTSRSDPALAFGCRLAALLKAQVTVLGTSVRSDWEPTLSRSLTDACAELSAAGLRCGTVIRQELPRRAIVAQATEACYDLIVVGLLERGRMRRWLRGPSTRRVLRDVAAPVLVVPADRPVLRHVLLCSGDLWYPAETIQLVGQIAQAARAGVTLLHVVPQPLLRYPILREVEDAWGALLQTDTPQGRSLKAGRDALRGLGIETGVRLRHGPVAEQIMSEIREGEYDLVALGSTYAARGLRHYFVSSITDFVVEHAGRPVLAVRHREGVRP